MYSLRRTFVQFATFCSLLSAVFGQTSIDDWGRACAAIMLPDVLKITYGNDSTKAFRDAMCGQYYSDSNGQFAIDVIEIFDAALGTKTVTRAEFCSQVEYVATSKTIYTFFSSTATDEARRLFLECMRAYPQQHGYASPLIMSFSNAANDAIAINVKWDKNVEDQQPLFSLLDSANIHCPIVPWRRGDPIPDNPTTVLCKWANSYSDRGFISITTNKGSGLVEAVRTITPLGSAQVMIVAEVEEVTGYARISGTAVETSDYHEKGGCALFGELPYPLYCFDKKWWGSYVRVSVPLPDGITTSDFGIARSRLRLLCDDRGNGSAAWNACDDVGRFRVVEENLKLITVERPFGSHNMSVQLVTDIPDRKKSEKTIRLDSYTLPREPGGYIFTIRVPKGNRGFIEVRWLDGARQTSAVGDSTSRLTLLPGTPEKPNPVATPSEDIYIYKVTWQTAFIDHQLYQ